MTGKYLRVIIMFVSDKLIIGPGIIRIRVLGLIKGSVGYKYNSDDPRSFFV